MTLLPAKPADAFTMAMGPKSMTEARTAEVYHKESKRHTSDPIEVYFGTGSFWDVQHDLVTAEKNILKRSNKEVTAVAGYAGVKPSKNLKVGDAIDY